MSVTSPENERARTKNLGGGPNRMQSKTSSLDPSLGDTRLERRARLIVSKTTMAPGKSFPRCFRPVRSSKGPIASGIGDLQRPLPSCRRTRSSASVQLPPVVACSTVAREAESAACTCDARSSPRSGQIATGAAAQPEQPGRRAHSGSCLPRCGARAAEA
jgi:hypothetical protein